MSPNRKKGPMGRFAPDFGDIRKLMFTKFCDISSHNFCSFEPNFVIFEGKSQKRGSTLTMIFVIPTKMAFLAQNKSFEISRNSA